MRRAVIGLLVVVVAACLAAPNLDETVADEPATAIRERIVDHGGWGDRLSAEQLDQLAAFIAEYAGAVDTGPASGAPGLVVWKDNDCGSCHILVAGEPGD